MLQKRYCERVFRGPKMAVAWLHSDTGFGGLSFLGLWCRTLDSINAEWSSLIEKTAVSALCSFTTEWLRKEGNCAHYISIVQQRLLSSLIGALSPVSHKGLHQFWKQTSVYLQVSHSTSHYTTSPFFFLLSLSLSLFFFQKLLQYFSLRDRLFVWLMFSGWEKTVGRWYVQHAAIWHWYLLLCIYIIF